MKKMLTMAALLLLTVAPMVGAQVDQSVGTLGFGVNGGLMIPVSGDVTVDSAFNDFFKAGPGFGAHFNYTFCKEAALRGGFSYTFMKMKDEAIGDSELEPHFSTPYFYLDGVLNFGGFMKPGGMINPYIVAGPGVYMWKVTDDGANGDAILVGEEEFKKTSLGIHFGPGIEIFATPKLSIFAEGKYHIVFTEDEEKFGADFANMSAIDISAGLTYHFNLGAK